MDPGMNNLLKWSIKNSESSPNPNGTAATTDTQQLERKLDADALKVLLGGPSDADLMKESMAAILSPDITLENKLIAFDNFEQLIEQIDNANNVQNMGLWPSLIELLSNSEPELRRYSCWVIGTIVQNNEKAQEQPVVRGIVPKLVELALGDENEQVRRKAIYALSSEFRNFQPGLDAGLKVFPKTIVPEGGNNANDMEAVDRIIERLRENSSHMASS